MCYAWKAGRKKEKNGETKSFWRLGQEKERRRRKKRREGKERNIKEKKNSSERGLEIYSGDWGFPLYFERKDCGVIVWRKVWRRFQQNKE